MTVPDAAGAILRDSVKGPGYLFLPVPKAGNSAVKTLLWQLDLDRGATTMPIPATWYKIHRPWGSYKGAQMTRFLADIADAGRFAFTVVRHPVNRLMSCYLDRIKRGYPGGRMACNPPLPRRPADFNEFVEMIEGRDDAASDIHWQSQALRLMAPRVTLDHYARFELIERLRPRLREALGGIKIPPFAARTPHRTNADELTQRIDPGTIRRIRLRYAADFEAFGYA